MNQWVKLALLLLAFKGASLLFTGLPHGTGQFSDADIARLATTVRTGDITMYTTTSCGYCAEARAWLQRHRIAFDECNTDRSAECGRALQAFAGTGVPYLVVRGAHMRDGFDPEQLLSLLAASEAR